MLDSSKLKQLETFIRRTDGLNRNGKLNMLEVIKHYGETIRQKQVQEPEASDERAGDETPRRASHRGRGSSRKR